MNIINELDVMYIVVYNNRKFLKDALSSVESLKKYHPDVHTTLYTDFKKEDITEGYFDNIITVDSPDRNNKKKDIWGLKYQCMANSQFKYNLHLDADTFICDNLSSLFKLLEHFDFVSPMSIHHISRRLREIPDSFPEFGGGVILWKSTDEVRAVFKKVECYVRNQNRRGCDEPYLRKAIYESRVRFAVIPWEYNCTFKHPGYLFNKVKIIHGRHLDLSKSAEIINTPLYKYDTVFKRTTGGGKMILFKQLPHRKYIVEREVNLL